MGEPGSSVSGVVGRDESSPASLKTRSKREDVRLDEEGLRGALGE